ncbi:enoyl-CoA hydratase [Aliiroseovarius subalbicans]|uniref:enoyl-CoA hydratase n=1 Tax=Aliiroseovarius subalbicans TaxID=2925840 RepID=UPI001F5AF1D6|nr:enoyl-CoA hydratase [Aliiroseovarius subalbicans]MCI2398461.1 enoyl-CoA hydratase [Aliiroseovarius subalbicans]
MTRKFVDFINEIAGILYVGGILSHIVIGAVIGAPDAGTAATVYQYKLTSAYILILPGLGLKILCDLLLYFVWQERAMWMKVKLVLIAFLSINAFVFLVPMMPELLALAQATPADGPVSDAFHALEGKEALVGMSNALPLALEIILGAFKPRLFGERRRKDAAQA